MKYIDPITKEKKTVYTKASDTLPLGAIVDFDGTEIPDGWEPAGEDATVYIGPNEPTDGQDIWIKKGKNLFDIRTIKPATTNGLSMTPDVANNTLNFTGTPTGYTSFILMENFVPKHDFIVSLNGQMKGTANMMLEVQMYKDGKYVTSAAADYYIGLDEYDFDYCHIALKRNNNVETNDSAQVLVSYVNNPSYEPYIDKKIYIKNEEGNYDLFVKNRVHVGPYQPEDGEEVWIKKSKNLYDKNGYMHFEYPNMYPTGKTELQSSGYIRSTSNYYSGYSRGQKIRVEKNTDYTLSFNVVDREAEGQTIVAIGYKSSAGTYGAFYTKSFKNILGLHVFNFNTGNNSDIIVSLNGVFNTEGKLKWIDYDNVQLEKGTPSSIIYESYVKEEILVKDSSGIYINGVKESEWEEAQLNSDHTKITVPINWDELKEVSIRTLGSDSATFGYMIIPKEQWHNAGAYGVLVNCINYNHNLIGYGKFTVTEKGNNYFVITKEGTSGSVQVLYKRK